MIRDRVSARIIHGRNLTQDQKRTLERLRSVVTFARASFSHIGTEGPFPTQESEVTEFIRERTRLYCNTWALPLIDALLSDNGYAEGIPALTSKK